MVPDIPVSRPGAEPGAMVDIAVDIAVDADLDARYLSCPMPLLKAKQALQRLQAGQRLRVLATDPGSVRDFQAWAGQSGHALLVCEERDNTFIYILRKNH
jgi:tRNA 2-thiouridine synthesizing protein A